jgi:hypothetical protein
MVGSAHEQGRRHLGTVGSDHEQGRRHLGTVGSDHEQGCGHLGTVGSDHEQGRRHLGTVDSDHEPGCPISPNAFVGRCGRSRPCALRLVIFHISHKRRVRPKIPECGTNPWLRVLGTQADRTQDISSASRLLSGSRPHSLCGI